MVKHISIPGEIQVIAISRQGQAFIPLFVTVISTGDIIHLAILASSMDRLKDLLGSDAGG